MPAATHAGGDTRDGVSMRCRIAARCAGTALLLLLASGIGCRVSTPERELTRLVDPEHRGRMVAELGYGASTIRAPSDAARPGTADYPRARIGDDTRFVLAVPASGVLTRRDVDVPPNGTVRVTAALDDALTGSSHLWLQPRARIGGTWAALPAHIVEVEDPHGRARVTVDLQLEKSTAGGRVELEIEGTAVDWETDTALRTGALHIPEHATLDLATGILEPGWDQGPVLFTVDACEGASCTPLYEARMDPAREEDRGWRDVTVPLDAYGGKSLTLVFRSKASPISGRGCSVPLWANPTIRVPRKPDRSAPNVVLLSIDSLGAGHLPTYGYFRETAPTLTKEFEQGGTVFDDCVAAATSTAQAYMSMLTGLQPLEHGVTDDLAILDPRLRTVVDDVRAAGVATAAITEDRRLDARRGFGRGFDEYRERAARGQGAPTSRVEGAFATAEAWLKRHADTRFFLLLGTSHVRDADVPEDDTRVFASDEKGDAVDARAPAHAREAQRHDRAIRRVDEDIASLLATLDELGLSDDTVILVTSDHGTPLTERTFSQDGVSLSEEVTHVPLMMRGPDIPRSRRIQLPVGHVDVASTIASFFQVEAPRGSRGVDLRRALRDNGVAVDGTFYFVESWDEPDSRFVRPAIAVRQGPRKLAHYERRDGSHRVECYDVANDPDEHTNLCNDEAREPADLAAALERYPGTTARRRAELLRVH